MAKGSGTRSGLLWEVERLLNECPELPQILLMENVPQVHSVKNKEHFDQWIAFLESKGYSNHWKDLNAKDYGIPQSRNRCYMVSILGEHSFEFPGPIPLEWRLGDLLEQEVDEKYYLSDVAIQGRQNTSFRQYNLEKSLVNGKDIHPTILARYDGSPTLLQEDTIKREVCNKAIESNLVIPYDIIDPSYANSRLEEINQGTISTKNSENNQIANTITTAAPNFGVCVPQCIGGVGEKKSREEPLEREGWHRNATEVLSTEGLCRTLSTQSNNLATKIKEPQSLRIRKLTPKECWRLMGFDDIDVEKAEKVCSNSQLYKQAGNSIVVNVLMAIFKELFVPKKTRSQWLDDLLNN